MNDDEKAKAEAPLKETPTPRGEPSASGDAGAAQVQQTVDEEEEQGYRGTKVDPRPDSDYSVAGAIDRKGEDLTKAGQ